MKTKKMTDEENRKKRGDVEAVKIEECQYAWKVITNDDADADADDDCY
jgi:hypothetical protein